MSIKNCPNCSKVSSWQKRHGYGLSLSILLSSCLVSISVSAAAPAENPVNDSPKAVTAAAPPIDLGGTASDNTALDNTDLVNNRSTNNPTTAETSNPNTVDATSDMPVKSRNPNSNEDVVASTNDTVTDNDIADTTVVDSDKQAVQSSQSKDTTTKNLENNKQQPFWKQLEYILGGLLIAALIWIMTLIRKVKILSEHNQILNNETNTLKKNAHALSQKLKSVITNNEELEEYKTNFLHLQSAFQNRQPSNNNDKTDDLNLTKTLPDTAIIDDLNVSDRKQLSALMTQWLMTNRGNTNFLETVPKELQQKLQQWQYTIGLWQQSSGIDAVELTQNTMHVAVISLTKPDHHGYAYCYKKPNSLSSLWTSKSWYQVQKNNGALIVLDDVLELN